MSQFACETCKSEFATCFCPCFFPNPRFCDNCCGKHSSHHLLPISLSYFVQTQDQYSLLLTRLSRFDQVKIHLGNDINQLAMWKAQLQNSEISEGIRTQNSQYLETLHRLLQQAFDSSLKDVKNNIINENYQPSTDIGMAIWAFVHDTEAQFPSFLVNTAEAESKLMTNSFRVEVKSLMPSLMQYRQAHKKTQGGIPPIPQPSNVAEINVEEQKLREASQMNPGRAPLHADLEAPLVNESPEAMRGLIEQNRNWIWSCESQCNSKTVCFTLCGCFVCWPIIGCLQANVVGKLLDSKTDPCVSLSCCAPTLCCCVGAALNRTFIRSKKGIEGNCCADLLLYSLHVFNCCLVFQEIEEVGGI